MWKPTHVDVTVIKAKDLIVKGKKTNDVYAIIQLGKEKFQTTTREKTVNPEWNEECSFEIPSDMSKTIEISLFHRNLLSIDQFLGRIALPVDELFSFQEKPHAQWYALRAKTSTTKKKAKYRGEMLIRTTFVFRSDVLTGPTQSQNSGSKKGLTPLGTDFLRKSATNLALSLKKSSFREKGHPDSEDKRNSTALATEDGNSRQRLSRSHSLAALTVALKRASFGRKSSKKHKKKDKDKEDEESETASTRHEYSDSEDDQTESIASHTRIDSDDEERDGLEKLNLDDSAVMQRKQYSLPHTVGSASQMVTQGSMSRAVSSVSAGMPSFEREGSGRLRNSVHNDSNDSHISGGPMQRQASGRSSASESGLSVDARSQSSGLAFPATYANGTPPKSSGQVVSANTPGRFSTTANTKGGSLRPGGESHHNNHLDHPHAQTRPPNQSPATRKTTHGGVSMNNGLAPSPRNSSAAVIPSKVYAEYGRMSREELLQVIAQLQIEVSRREEYIDYITSRAILEAPEILQQTN